MNRVWIYLLRNMYIVIASINCESVDFIKEQVDHENFIMDKKITNVITVKAQLEELEEEQTMVPASLVLHSNRPSCL